MRGSFPEDIKGEIQYGKNIAAFLVAMNTVGAVSAKRIQEIAGNLFDLPISTGTVTAMVSRCASKVKPALKMIKNHMSGAVTDTYVADSIGVLAFMGIPRGDILRYDNQTGAIDVIYSNAYFDPNHPAWKIE